MDEVFPIKGTASATNLGLSGIAHDLDKFDATPPGLVECGPVQETGTAEELQVERVYTCPWSLLRDARAYFLGYSFAQVVTPTFNYISRVVPAQDPTRPHLYASRCDLVECCGAPLDDPDNFLLGPDGEPFEGRPGDVRSRVHLPAIAFADNRGASGVEPDDWGPGQGFYDGVARLRVTYTHRPYRIKNDAQAGAAAGLSELSRYVERAINPNIEAIPLVRIAGVRPELRFSEGPAGDAGTAEKPGRVIFQKVPEAGIQLLATGQISYTWYEVPHPPWDAMLAALGTVNAEQFDNAPGFPTYGPQTLLYLQPKVYETRNPVGAVTWRIVQNFSFRQSGWNNYPCGGGLGFFRATFGGKPGDPTVYPTSDFLRLFESGVPVNYDG